MKSLKSLCSALLLLAAITVAVPASAGTTSQYFAPKSPLRYHVCSYVFSTTANIASAVGGTVCVIPPGGAILKDVVMSQNAAGVGGTSWVATPKRGATNLVSTAGGFTLAGGAGLTTNASASPMGAITNPTGGTRPVVQASVHASGTITVADALAAGEIATINGIAFTSVASGATGRQWNVGADEDADAVNLAAAINAYGGPFVATAALHVVTVKWRTPGTAGNAITLTKTGDHLSVSGSTLASGWNATASGGELVTIDVTLTGTYSTAVGGSVQLYFEPVN